MDDSLPLFATYREPEFSSSLRRKAFLEDSYILVTTAMFLVFRLFMPRELDSDERIILDGLTAYFVIIGGWAFADNLKSLKPLEIARDHIVLPSIFYKLIKGKELSIPKENVHKIYPWSSHSGKVDQIDIETRAGKVYQKNYPCAREERVQLVVKETIRQLKLRFPECYQAARWEQTEKEEEEGTTSEDESS